jgi:phosphotransferase system enzyme I (PtsI)
MLLKGNGVSAGIAVGKTYIYQAFKSDVHEAYFEKGKEAEQLDAWRLAKEKADAELDAIIAYLDENGDDKADIFRAHKEILFDEEIDEMVTDAIQRERTMPDFAIERTFGEFIELLGRARDKLISERTTDLRDVRNRLIRTLSGQRENNLSLLPEEVIVVAHDLLPSDTATIDRSKVIGIITEVGSATSHSAIIARSYRIPAILSVPKATKILQNGEYIAMDAMDGTVAVNPDEAALERYRRKKESFDREAAVIETFQTREARLKSGQRVEIGINVGGETDAEGYDDCDFIGLFRTEFLYMGKDHLPSEEEQFEAYKAIIERAGGKPVTLRTLDIGGDKTLNYMELPKEDNPFLGKRALRLCFDRPELFRTQLTAALRASAFGKLKIMFPMVGSIEDFRKAKQFVEKVKIDLDKRGCVFDREIPLGIMIEIPSIAAVADLAAKEVDFASIGTNDLCQYFCAVDRMNDSIGGYYQSFSPAFIRLLAGIIRAFNDAGKDISMCGELAGDPKATGVLIGIGLRKFSMNAASVAKIKWRLSELTVDRAEDTVQKLKQFATQEEILRYLEKAE